MFANCILLDKDQFYLEKRCISTEVMLNGKGGKKPYAAGLNTNYIPSLFL